MHKMLVALSIVSMMMVGLNGAEAVDTEEDVISSWELDEPVGAIEMSDSSGNGLHGAIGSDVMTGVSDGGGTSYRWLYTPPTAPPAKPERLVIVPHDAALNPRGGNYSVSLRYRTMTPFGNIIQKGQGGAPGGYWKIENPAGHLTCVFRGVSPGGGWNRREVVSPQQLNDGAYHAVTCERSGGRLHLIVDGVEVDTAEGSTGDISNNRPLSLGGKSNCNNTSVSCDYFTGWVDSVEIRRPTVAPPVDGGTVIFADDFSAGLSSWTSTQRLAIDHQDGATSPPSALVDIDGATGFGLIDFAPQSSLCVDVAVKPVASNGAVDLLRMRTDVNGKMAVLYLNAKREIVLKNEVTGASINTKHVLTDAWHKLRWCGANSGVTSLGVDETGDVGTWSWDPTSDHIGRLQIGTTRKETMTVLFDDITVSAP